MARYRPPIARTRLRIGYSNLAMPPPELPMRGLLKLQTQTRYCAGFASLPASR
jgi:hypothetical protein